MKGQGENDRVKMTGENDSTNDRVQRAGCKGQGENDRVKMTVQLQCGNRLKRREGGGGGEDGTQRRKHITKEDGEESKHEKYGHCMGETLMMVPIMESHPSWALATSIYGGYRFLGTHHMYLIFLK